MILLESKRINRTLKRMSYQILEIAGNSSVCLVGINSRGHSIAGIIKNYLDEVLANPADLYHYDERSDQLMNFKSSLTDNHILVIVDDVIFSGETMFNCIQRIPELSDFQKICVAVLADRGHRKFPILASIVGIHVPTKLNEHVELIFEDNKPNQLVLL